MFIISCKYNENAPIIECIESLQKFHPTQKILIQDSNSENKEYFNYFKNNKNILIVDPTPNMRVRQMGSLYETYRKYPNEEEYITIHDTIILKKPLTEFINSDNLFYTFMYFNELLKSEYHLEYEMYKNIFSQTKYKLPPPLSLVHGSFGTMFIAKNKLMKLFDEKGLLDVLKPLDKVDDQIFERIIGECATQEGYNPKDYNISGNFLDYTHLIHGSNKVLDNIEYFKKVFLGRC